LSREEGRFFFEGAFMRGKSHDCAVRGGAKVSWECIAVEVA